MRLNVDGKKRGAIAFKRAKDEMLAGLGFPELLSVNQVASFAPTFKLSLKPEFFNLS
ncbi:MAG: hypothetical protein AB4426_26800 [Xenococcaceae cyanobacterium]